MASLTAHDIEKVIFHVAEALRVPVLVLALLALAAVLVELGGFITELLRRRRRDFARLELAVGHARERLGRKDENGAFAALRPVAWSRAMERAMATLVIEASQKDPGDRLNKRLADFDFGSLRRLERTRWLVRAGPALGLMGTLIPLSPALAGLAAGDVKKLSDNLRVAFSVTVLGLLVRPRVRGGHAGRHGVGGAEGREAAVPGGRPACRGEGMSSLVSPRARRHVDRAGDPLDGLVNLFDLGIVLAVAFLLAALSSLRLTGILTERNVSVIRNTPGGSTIIQKQGQTVHTIQLSGQKVIGQGRKIGEVYRLSDGREVLVQGP
jgi:biopolymer transport protein ExbB/TolQ